jgi:hypothetical protein
MKKKIMLIIFTPVRDAFQNASKHLMELKAMVFSLWKHSTLRKQRPEISIITSTHYVALEIRHRLGNKVKWKFLLMIVGQHKSHSLLS